jgi:light-regulated signal transduction histidine kinase (bacteriophytochrome)
MSLGIVSERCKTKLDAEANKFINYAVDESNRMQMLIEDLLNYSRVGKGGLEFKPIDCLIVLDQTLDNLLVPIERSGARITHDPLPKVMGDPTQLTQLFQNLIDNAIKFHGDRPPRIHVSAKRKGDEWVFSVRDKGIGFDPQHVERIFTAFERLLDKTEHPGSGIGLAICRKIVERHGGRIWAKSLPGKGSTFYFTIPAMKRVSK